MLVMLVLVVACLCLGTTNLQHDVSKYSTRDSVNDTFSNDLMTAKHDNALNYKAKYSHEEGYLTADLSFSINFLFEAQEWAVYEIQFLNASMPKSLIEERFDFYFLSKDNIIVKIDKNTFDMLNGHLSADFVKAGEIVYQETPLEDNLAEDEKGWHHSISIDGSIIQSTSYNDLVETGYFETFVWQKEFKLLEYRSGFGAERDLLHIEMVSD